MGKGSKFLDWFKVSDDDEDYDDDDDIFDDDTDDEDDDYIDSYQAKQAAKKEVRQQAKQAAQTNKKSTARRQQTTYSYGSGSSYSSSYGSRADSTGSSYSTATATDRVVDFGSRKSSDKPKTTERKAAPAAVEICVIHPTDYPDARYIVDYLKDGVAVVITLEGLPLDVAQRIIDFVGGACNGLEGQLDSVTASTFIASPKNVDVSGDFYDKVLADSTVNANLH